MSESSNNTYSYGGSLSTQFTAFHAVYHDPIPIFPVPTRPVVGTAGVLITKLDDPRQIRTGGHSNVCPGVFLTSESAIEIVAIKELRITEDIAKMFEREFRCWRRLEHKNIAHFMGVQYQSSGFPALISLWYKNGASYKYVKDNPDVDCISLIKGIADGLAHLHENSVVHGDLKGGNVLIGDDGTAKITDFGLSRILDEHGFTTSTYNMTIRWCAPELLVSSEPTKEGDIYAFATTAGELLSGEVPHRSCVNASVILKVYQNKQLPFVRRDVRCSDQLWALLLSCWEADPTLRPTIQEVRVRLRGIDA